MKAQQEQMAEQQRKMDEQAAEQKAESDRLQAEKDETERKRQEAEDERLLLVKKENTRLEEEAAQREAEKQAEIDADTARKEAEAEVARLEEARPARERLIQWADDIAEITIPELGDSDLKAMAINTSNSVKLVCAALTKEVEAMGENPSEAPSDSGAF